MNLKGLITGLMALLLLLPLQARAGLHLEFGIEPIYSLAFANPAKDYFSDLNEDFRTGAYTFTTPIPDWKDIKTPTFNEFGGEGSCLARLKSGKTKNLRLGIVLGFRMSSPTSMYDKSYDIWDEKYQGGKYIPSNFKRQENISTSTFFLGARGKASLTDKIDVSTTLGLNFYKVKGDVKYTLDRLDNPFVQYRKADYKGKGTGLSVEAGATYKFRDHIWVGAALGYRTGKVKTKGKQVVTCTSWPEGYSVTGDYSPKFNFNSTYGKFYIGISF